MLKVHSAPLVKPNPQFGKELVYWLGPAGDHSIPFRQALDEITSIIAHAKPSALDLPLYEEGEDFVEGELHFGDDIVSVYYEYSLGYLLLGSSDASALGEIEFLTRAITKVA
ncbi:hypothetical protein [Sphingomonas psychrolutea]|uniref:Uncharacterized protein n=1 Tax=Sphingomonas psychrolutea TaxID=1259676 RepID=A0ABQ1GRA2_9SPHN|nr:hypothetical protein [Sphingomonas psychrolutea]GGA48739.1 hypothetical protein GCM10011395_18800 [Sphingomonas psychrolutea]